MDSILFLILILILGALTKNQTIMISSSILVILVLLKLDDNVVPFLNKYAMKIGITLFTIYAFTPIAMGEVTFKDLFQAITTLRAWVAIAAGIIITQFAKHGITYMATTPELTTYLVVGIIIGVVMFGGVATGPLIGSGIAVFLYFIVNSIISIFS